MGREIRVPQSHSRKSPVREAVESDTTYRIVVGEKGNEQGHIEYLDDGTTEDQAKKELRKALRAYVGDGWGRVEYDVDGTGWRKLGESKRRVVESGAADLIGSGTLPNKYYVSHHGDFQVLRNGNELDWASEDEDLSSRVTFGNGGEDGVFDTFDAALEKAESVAEGISEDADDLRSVIIEDHISGVIYEIILVAYPTKFGYKFEVERWDDTRFTREKLGSKFESKRRVVEEVSASQIPVDEVVAELKDIRDDMAVTPSEDGIESEDDFMDVRLQVLDDGSWMLHTGDASYDTDHHGSWGAGTMTALDTDEELLTLAQDLISQADDMKAQVETRLLKGRRGLKEGRKEQNPPKSWIPVDEVVAELKDIRDDMAVTPSEDGIESEDDFMDVRLQVLDDGSWVLHTGDASYDTDHHGSWGASEIVPTMTDEELREMAEDLINQAEDMRVQVESRPRAGKKGLQERYKEQNPPKNWTPATVIGKLQRLQKQHPAEYDRLTDAWRDHLPHTGEQDVLLGSPKFKQWLESEYQEWVEYPKEWQNWAAFCTDLRGLTVPEMRESSTSERLQKGKKGLQESVQGSSFLYVYDGTGGPISVVLEAEDLEEAVEIAKTRAGEWYDAAENILCLESHSDVAAGDIESFGYDADQGFTLSPNERLYPKGIAIEERNTKQVPLNERKRRVDISGLQKRGKPVETFQFKSFTVDKAKAEKEGR